jgi:hypothetical protein
VAKAIPATILESGRQIVEIRYPRYVVNNDRRQDLPSPGQVTDKRRTGVPFANLAFDP